MKLLYIEIEGLKFLNDEKVKIDYLCSTKVLKEQVGNQVTQIGKSIYINNVVAFSGINASGKTTLLRLQKLVTDIIFKGEKLSSLKDYSLLLDKTNAKIKVVVFDRGTYKFYEAHIENYNFMNESILNIENSKIDSRKQLKLYIENFSNDEIKTQRIDRKIEGYKNISKEISLLESLGEKKIYNEYVNYSTDFYTNNNALGFVETPIILEVIQLLDENIEYIKDLGNDLLELKFYNQEKIIGNVQNVSAYLSSGTIKGITLFSYAYVTLGIGGYLSIDEIELHLHKTLILKIIDLFMDKNTNPNGANLMFTTHYSEILDAITRYDAIYILQKEKNKIKPIRMSDMYPRNDVKNSRLYLSGILNSAPSYEHYIALKRKLAQTLKLFGENNE